MADKRWDKDFQGSWHEFFSGGVMMTLLVLVVVGIMAVGGLAILRYVAPEEERIRRDTYEESKSYLDGTVRDLDNLRLQWHAATNDVHRDAIASTALHRAADFPEDRLPDRIADWLGTIKEGP